MIAEDYKRWRFSALTPPRFFRPSSSQCEIKEDSMSTAFRPRHVAFRCSSTVVATLLVALTGFQSWSLTGQENRAEDFGIVCLHSDGSTDSVIEISLHDKKVRKPKFRQPFKPSYLSIALAPDGKTFAYHV